MITADGCWADFRIPRKVAQGRPCLYLDRDGVLIKDVGYPHRRDDVRLIGELLELVRVAHRAGYVTGIVTNQSGIARGLFEWPAFVEVQDCIDEALRTLGAALDFVLACPFHADATIPRYRCDSHPWRKPNPGMLRAAAERLGLDLSRSIMVGDRAGDIEAGAAAGIPHLWHLTDAVVGGATLPGAVAVRRTQVVSAMIALGPAVSARGGGGQGRASD